MTHSTHSKPIFSTLTAFLLLFSTGSSDGQTVSQAGSPTQKQLNTSTQRLGIISFKSTKIPTGPIGWAIFSII